MPLIPSLDYPYKVKMFKVAAGNNGAGQVEYVCETDVLTAANSDSVWRIRKMVYDSDGFNTEILWANGTKSFDKSVDNRTTYTYS